MTRNTARLGICESCGRDIGNGERHRVTTSRPDLSDLEDWMDDGVAQATDGCSVEPDGQCEHGHKSWLLVMGLI